MIVMGRSIIILFQLFINRCVIAIHMLLVIGFRECSHDEKIHVILHVVYCVSLVKISDQQIIMHYS